MFEFNLFKLAILAGMAAVASAAPLNSTLSARSFNCNSPIWGLSQADCQHMSNIGFAGQGENARSNNGRVWIGTGGSHTITFTNRSPVGVTAIMWDAVDQPNAPDYQCSFVNVRAPRISYSLAAGASVTVSLASGIHGGWSALYDHKTILSSNGQIWNTWGEWSTGSYATIDISREIHMAGNSFDARLSGSGCVANMDKCVYKCNSGDTCWTADSYYLQNCDPGSQPGAAGHYDTQWKVWTGGCQGWENGHVDANFY